MQSQTTTVTACSLPAAWHGTRATLKVLFAYLLLVVSGCTVLGKAPQPEPSPALEPIVITRTAREPAPLPEPAAPRTAPLRQPDPPAVSAADRIAILLSDRSPAYESVAIELGRQLGEFLLYDLADKSLSPQEVFSGLADSDARAVIAIGLKAAEQAMGFSTLPIVFCQVFNIDVHGSVAPIRGVAAIPPLGPQVKAWKQAHPELERIGAILGEGHDELIAEAQVAAEESGVEFRYRIAGSDRETLYMFNRMAREVDGFWLFPDNRVLSMPVLEEILGYASRHDVQIAVFNPALLELGAELNVSSDYADIAATAIAVAERIIDGELAAIPPLTPLTRVEVQTAAASLPDRRAPKGTP